MSSLLPAVATALTAAAAAALPSVRVVDGPVQDGDLAADWLFVGAEPDDGPGGSTSDGAAGVLPEFVVAEVVNLSCVIQCWTADPAVAFATLRARAYGYVDQLEQLLVPDPAGVVLGLPALAWARVAGTTYLPRRTRQSRVDVAVSIACQGDTATR